jgi:hypothetical protein
MSPIKYQLIYILVTLMVSIVTINSVSLHIGMKHYNDSLACFGDVHIRSQKGKIIHTERFCNLPKRNQTITQILASDIGLKNKGGFVRIVKGGLHKRNVTLHLWSQKSQPLNFTILIYGKLYK